MFMLSKLLKVRYRCFLNFDSFYIVELTKLNISTLSRLFWLGLHF